MRFVSIGSVVANSLCLFLSPVTALAQSAAAPQLSVTYEQRLNGRAQPPATLVIGQGASLYYFNRTASRAPATDLRQQDETHYVVEVADAEGSCVYHHPAQPAVLVREYDLGSKQFVLIEDTLPRLRWQIGNATRQIGQFQAQQATTTFRGRQYEAWFTPEIPLPLGPWKLGGLPGLILEARDATGQVSFVATTVAQPAAVATPVAPPTQGRRFGSWAAYHQYAAEAERRLVQFMQAQTPGMSVKISRTNALELAP